MTNPAKHTHHHIDYIEFTVNHLEKAKSFYSAAFDWKFNDYGPAYAGIQKENGEAGGLCLDTNETAAANRSGPLVILYSESLESSFTKVKQAGGKITKEIFAFPGGRRFQFQDPSGNELAVWSEK